VPDRGPRDFSENSPLQMQQVIGLLLSGATVNQIAAEVGIPPSRITRWYRESADFKQMLAETEANVVEAVRDAIVAEQQQTIIDLLPAARETLARSLDVEQDIPASVRVTAAAHVYRLAGYGSGTERGSSGPRPVGEVAVEGVVRTLDARPASGD
jgi:AcrR family transcriptional regulator